MSKPPQKPQAQVIRPAAPAAGATVAAPKQDLAAVPIRRVAYTMVPRDGLWHVERLVFDGDKLVKVEKCSEGDSKIFTLDKVRRCLMSDSMGY